MLIQLLELLKKYKKVYKNGEANGSKLEPAYPLLQAIRLCPRKIVKT